MITITEFTFSDSNFYVKNGMVMTFTAGEGEIALCSIEEFIKAANALQNALDFIEMNEEEIKLEE